MIYYHYTWGEDTPKRLTTAMQQELPRNVTDFKQATGFQISRRSLRKLHVSLVAHII
jgi:hypothetical protein